MDFQKAGNSHVKLNIHSIKQVETLSFVLQFSPTRSLSAKVRTEHGKRPLRASSRLIATVSPVVIAFF